MKPVKTLKNLVLSLACATILIVTGILLINDKISIEEKQSSYKLTDFEYVITTPSKEQINDFKANKEAVNDIFPCVLSEVDITGNSKEKIKLLLSDQMDKYQVGLFNDKTLLKGKHDINGISLDEKAAKLLNVDINSKVSMIIKNVKHEFTVTAIYMTSTYGTLDKGLGLINLSDEIKGLFKNDLTYSYAFIDAKDEKKCAKLLDEYKPLGLLISEDDYIADYKDQNKKPPILTDDEWTTTIKNAYLEYKENYLSQKFNGSVQIKDEYMSDVLDQISSTNKRINYMSIALAVGTLIIYTVLSIILIQHNYENDTIEVSDGASNVTKPYYYGNIVGTLGISILTALVLVIYGLFKRYFESYIYIILILSLPILLSTVVVLPFIARYGKSIKSVIKFSNNSTKNKNQSMYENKKSTASAAEKELYMLKDEIDKSFKNVAANTIAKQLFKILDENKLNAIVNEYFKNPFGEPAPAVSDAEVLAILKKYVLNMDTSTFNKYLSGYKSLINKDKLNELLLGAKSRIKEIRSRYKFNFRLKKIAKELIEDLEEEYNRYIK